MALTINTIGVSHLALRSSDLARSKRFYADILGFPLVLDTEAAFVFLAGASAIGVLAPDAQTSRNDRFSSSRVGIDHIALGCPDAGEIARVSEELTAVGIGNTGVKIDPATAKPYVAFDDPDGITWELYLV